MSDIVIKLIPTEPTYVPSAECIETLQEWLQSYDAEIVLSDEVRFIDQGTNFEDIKCPLCSSNIEIDWWQQKMDRASNRSFHMLDIVTECCNLETTLNQLIYNWDAGFARFSIDMMNPSRDIPDQELKAVESRLKCSLKKVIAHY